MQTWLTRAAVGLLAVGFCCEHAGAQQPTRRPVRRAERPTLSPYLNLLRTDRGGFGSELFLEVRPRFRALNAIGRGLRANEALRRDQARTQQQLGRLVRSLTSQLGTTGHSAGFMTHRRYFGTGRR